VETVRRLRRHKFPFAGALRTVLVDGLQLSPAHPKYVKPAQTRGDHFDRRFEAIKNRVAELLPRYVELAEAGAQGSAPATTAQEACVALYGRSS
jgi:hypothetical protein